MNFRLSNNLKKMWKLVRKKCKDCQFNYECCDKMFCKVTEANLKNLGKDIKKTSNEVFYLGDKGCTVPYKYRILCTGFICNHHYKDKDFMRKWGKVDKLIKGDPEAQRIMGGGPSVEEMVGMIK